MVMVLVVDVERGGSWMIWEAYFLRFQEGVGVVGMSGLSVVFDSSGYGWEAIGELPMREKSITFIK